MREALVVAVVALAWMASFEGNAWLFSELEHSGRAHWIFLPAALRLLAILMFGARGALGLVLGSLVTALGTSGGDTLHEIVLAVSSGLLPWAAISAGRALFNLPDNLSGIRAQHIIAMCTMSAGANASGSMPISGLRAAWPMTPSKSSRSSWATCSVLRSCCLSFRPRSPF